MARAGRTSWWTQQAAGPVIIQDAAGNYLRLPKLTTTQRDALTAVNGMLIFNSTTVQVEEYNGSWQAAGQKYGDATFLPLAGGTMTGDINLSSHLLTGALPAVANLFGVQMKVIPFQMRTAWDQTAVANGTVAGQWETSKELGNGAGANGSILIYSYGIGLNRSNANSFFIDWAKRLALMFGVSHESSNAEATWFAQLKQVQTIGELAAKGIGVSGANLTVAGKAYGTSLGTAAGILSMTAAQAYEFMIWHDPAVGETFYVNGVAVGTITGAGTFPTTIGSANSSLVFSHANGASGGDSRLRILNPLILQEM